MIIRTYSELSRFRTFDERFDYLQLNGVVGKDTFGFDRYFNQLFYRSKEWKHIRNIVIIRDNGCDLGCEGHDIYDKILIHHMNPISIEDINESSDILLNPEFLICTSQLTHNAIHYGNKSQLINEPLIRTPGDTCPWKK